MNNNPSEQSFSSGDVAPNPFLGGPDQGAIPTIPGFDMAAAKKAPINVHGVLTIGILCIAGAAIWGMRSIGIKSLPAATQAQDSSLVVDPTGRPAVMTVDDQRLLADLNASRITNQVPGDELQKNPFSMSEATRPKPKAVASAPVPKDATPEQVRQARQQELLNALSEYKLQGVMGGTNAVARINGKPYRIGDKLGEKPSGRPGDVNSGNANAPQFTVSAIEGREVTVTFEDFSFVLSMDGQ
jgi:hypothetical protein